MSWVYGHYKMFILSVRGTNLDVRIWRVHPALKGLMSNQYCPKQAIYHCNAVWVCSSDDDQSAGCSQGEYQDFLLLRPQLYNCLHVGIEKFWIPTVILRKKLYFGQAFPSSSARLTELNDKWTMRIDSQRLWARDLVVRSNSIHCCRSESLSIQTSAYYWYVSKDVLA